MIPTRDDADFAEQLAVADAADREAGLDLDALTPPSEFARAAWDSANPADVFDQSWITPMPDDDYPLAY
ncbi:hypothetical protein [Nocardia ignorata]|uniref:Uncharacterized protein n=1 Tax=Nocardia ignorata TaxID=145285 RepID=A0A4R6PJV2_NOCIG|nr:hypothetical protein [Nocardia ignorata]TDP37990.1 hypothetical protein DFR75_104342 [Nocardia ignorata]